MKSIKDKLLVSGVIGGGALGVAVLFFAVPLLFALVLSLVGVSLDWSSDIRAGVQVDRPGLYLFRGYWYGNSPLSHRSYGKIEGQRGKVVGHMRSHQQAKALHI